MESRICVFIFISITANIGVHSIKLKLTPAKVFVTENSSATITCSKSNGSIDETRWTNSQFLPEDANLYSLNEKCISTRFLNNSDLFKGFCNQNGTYSVELLKVNRSQHGTIWKCIEDYYTFSNNALIYVSVPATSVEISQPNNDYVEENQEEEFTCRTSASRPDPRVQWYLQNAINSNREVYNLTQFSTNIYINSTYSLKTVTSTLHFVANRTLQNFRLYCEVWSQTVRPDSSSKYIIFNVTYPPDVLPKIMSNKISEDVRVIESDTGLFICSVTGGNPLASLTWNCFDSDNVTITFEDNTVISTIKWTARRYINKCSCTAHHLNNWKKITNISVNVQYPPSKPNLTMGSTQLFGEVRVIRNKSVVVVCKSESNPSPNYTWTGPGVFSSDGATLKITSVKRNDQGIYVCNASNRMTRSDNSITDESKSILLNLTVLYPPNTPNFIFGNKNGQLLKSHVLYVVQKDSFTVYCDADGNPVPNVMWDDNDRSRVLRISTISENMNRTCIATNSMKETTVDVGTDARSLASLSINVLYPPGNPTIDVSNFNGASVQGQGKIISIIESETIYLTCFSKSKPTPTYQWFHSQSSEIQGENTLTFQKITRNDSGVYTCNVQNLMLRSNGTIQEGKNKSNTTLNIFYPAIVEHIGDKSVMEGSELKKVCPVLNGNPSNSTVVWSRQIDHNQWDNELLHIRNVSRTDDSLYTCSVTTNLSPTFGSYSKIERKQSFHLNVFFQSDITKFSINTSSQSKTFITNQMDQVYLVCIAEANPPSNLTIKHGNSDFILEVSNSNIVSHTIYNASCANAGEYECTGRNNITRSLPAKSFLTLIVRCPPKSASSGDTSVVKVATVLNVNVTLQFLASSYFDEPSRTIFSWYKENDSLSDFGRKYNIDTNGLQTNLIIMNTTILDLGLYRVSVKNSAGEYDHYYDVKATDKPDPPSDFRFINDSLTDKSVNLTWVPGFDGGFQQTFVILYKMKSASIWLNISVIDTEKKNMNITLYDLKSMHEYQVEMFAENKEGISAKTNRLQFKTKESLTTLVKSSTTDQTAIIAGSLSGVICIVAAITIFGIVLFLRKRQNKNSNGLYQNIPFIAKKSQNHTNDSKGKQKKAYKSHTEETTFKGERKISETIGNNSVTDGNMTEGLQEIDDVPIIMNERTEYCNSQEQIDKIERITITELYVHVFGNEDVLEIEYQKLPTGLQKPCTFARRPDNLALNRYNGIYPYDHSRVKIPEQPDFFINACYIDGYKGKKTYIASLGPTSKTTSDFKTFWQMIWHEKTDLIVMLTNLLELSGMKCEQYWPESSSNLQYGDVLVTCKTTEVYADYTIRTFDVSKENQRRSLTHLHYTAWPDKTVPEDVTSLLEFRKKMKNVPSTHKGPIVIHCSAGIGRTGTLIALDILIEEGHDIGSVNVFECVKSLRDQRVKMVQTFEQYFYIYKALVNSLSFECETFTRKRIIDYLSTDNDRQYNTLFQQLKLSVETDSTTEQNERTKNSSYSIKNRQGADIPGDRFRVFLDHIDERDGSDYINAVFVNSFKQKDHFIIAQSPLQTTVTDFLSMIYHGDCYCIASMEDLKEPGMAVGTYLPEKNKPITFGSYEVSCSKFEDNAICVVRKMKIKYTGKFGSGEKCFYHFQYTKWMTGSKTPGDVTDFVQFVQEVEEYANELGEERSRVVVHCLKANERSCLFCAVAIIIEKLKIEGHVNILNVIRHLRTRRRSAIVSKEQLKFCYEAAGAFVRANRH